MRPRARVVGSARATNYHRAAARSVFPTEVQHVRLNQSLVDAARDPLERRFPGEEGIAAAMYTEDGAYVHERLLRARVGQRHALRRDRRYLRGGETGQAGHGLGVRFSTLRRGPHADPDTVRYLPGTPLPLGTRPRSGRPRPRGPDSLDGQDPERDSAVLLGKRVRRILGRSAISFQQEKLMADR